MSQSRPTHERVTSDAQRRTSGRHPASVRRTINIVEDRAGRYVLTIRGGRVRRFRRITAASLERVRAWLRRQAQRGSVL